LLGLQIGEGRLAQLEAQRQQLLAQERELQKETSQAAGAQRQEKGGAALVRVRPDGQPEYGSSAESAGQTTHAAQASGRLEEVRRSRQGVEQAIRNLQRQIAAWEKLLENTSR
jgi:hypothetical protein